MTVPAGSGNNRIGGGRLGGLELPAALVLVGAYLFPLYWMYVTALKTQSEIFRSPPSFWPHHLHAAFVRVFVDHAMAHYLWNTTLIAGGTTLLTVLLGTGGAYVLARHRNGWANAALFVVLVLQALPPSLLVTPIFVAFNQLGLLATPRLAVVLAQTGRMVPLFIVLCRASFAQVPRELEEAAQVDGASRWQAFRLIAIPLARNGILVSAILVFLQSLGEYVYSRSLIVSDSLQTATVGLRGFLGTNTTDWGGIMTYAAIYVTPILLIFAVLQSRIVGGLTAGALK